MTYSMDSSYKRRKSQRAGQDMSFIASFLIRQAGRAAASRFETATKDPGRAQHNKLMEILKHNQETQYGREYGFASIKSLDDYRARVPVVAYEDIKDLVEGVARGEKNVLTSEDPVMFAQTSGTTDKPKYIPVTPTCLARDHADQMRTWIHHASNKHPKMLQGKVVSLVSPAVEGYTESGRPYGSTSGHIYRNMPRTIRRTYAIPYEVSLIRDYDSKYYVLMRVAMSSDVTFLGTANPSSILKILEHANEHADELLRDLADGTLRKDLAIEPNLRQVIERGLKPHPKETRRLERARVLRSGKLLPADYWPNLALIGCWKGGTVGNHIKKFPHWFDPDRQGMPPVRDWGYLSSEARGSIPLSDHGSEGVLTVNASVVEFVRVDNLEDNPHQPDRCNFLGVNELERGQEYYVFFTTTGGLYRYDINDVVQVVGRYNATPTIVFRRKGRGMSNITGEKLSVNQIMAAFENASRVMGISIAHFKAEADIENARYVFKVESPALAKDQRKTLLQQLDRHLSELNIEYEAKRKSFRLNDPVLHVMKPGWYERQKKALAATGKRLFQSKTVLLDAREGYQEDPENLEALVNLGD